MLTSYYEILSYVIHGQGSKVKVIIGQKSVAVHDDGIGIEPDSLEKYVGTDHCTSSSSMYLPVHIEPICNQTPCTYIEKEKHGIICPQQHFLIEEGKREFLKALTSMCEEVNIVSKCIVPCPDGKYSHKPNKVLSKTILRKL